MTDKSKKPKRRGRQPDASSKSGKIRELLKTSMSVSEIAAKLGCTTALVYNVKARAAKGTKRGPGRRAQGRAAGGGLESLVAAVRQVEQQRSQLRSALEKIQVLVRDAMA